ncbi:YfjI family protein [Pseudomonas sp. C9-3]|uniref:YfjI family protein n=1 Tax=Pseudomonas sp. C9-3 TaxID=3078264 RepID=UPI0028E81D9E|nr:YfjI family protein [Pseudomonas sp. C9-3]
MSEIFDARFEDTDPADPRMQDGWPCYREHSLFEGAVEESSRQLEVSREMSMMCAFGAMATTCQRHVDVQMPPGNKSNTSLMLLTIAESGERKTTTQNYFFESISAVNQEAIDAHDETLREHRIKQEIWSTQKQYLERSWGKLASSGGKGEADAALQELEDHLRKKPEPNPSEKFLYEDTTPQALVQYLYENSAHGCLLTSEANSIFNGKIVNELDKLNTLWDGGSLIVDRLSRAPITLKNARLTMSLMAQPSVISNFMGRRGEEARGTGFLARFLISKPKSMAGERSSGAGKRETPRKTLFNERARNLLEAPSPKVRQVLTFSEPAKSLWFKINENLEKQMQDGGWYRYMRDHASKLLENTSRLAAIIHAFERKSEDDSEIDLFTLKFSWKFAQACSRDFKKNLASDPQIVTDTCELASFLIQECYKDIRNKEILEDGLHKRSNRGLERSLPAHLRDGMRTTVTLTKIKQYGPNRLRGRANAERLLASMEILTRLGHLAKNGSQYSFRESIINNSEPELRNGESITINILPLFSDQELYKPEHPIRHLTEKRYCIRLPI